MAQPDNCAKVRRSLAKARANTVAACVEVGPSKTWRDSDEITALAVLPLPEFCIEKAFQGWWFTRKNACMVRSGLVNVLQAPRLNLIGQIEFLEINLSYTSASIETWAQQIEIRMFGGWGQIAGTTVQGTASCSGACAATRSNFPPQLVTTGRDEEGEAFFDTTAILPGSIGFARTTFTYEFRNPSWTVQPLPFSASPFEVRCDNAVPGTAQTGCVFWEYESVMIYSHLGAVPEVARHLQDAQGSGLPGAYPEGPTLNRMVNPVLQAANRARACPDRYPRPAGKTCDEYPFASTRQGAATATPPGVARTFDWCEIDEPPGVGPIGYSVCMIDGPQNSLGGTFLQLFLVDNRVVDNDPFFVWIVDGGGGGGGGSGAPIPPRDLPPTVNAGPDVAGDEGAQIQLHGSATDAESTPQVRWTYAARDDVDEGAQCSFGDANAASTTFACTDDGTYTVTLTASDGTNDPVSDSAAVRVANVAPTLTLTAPVAWQLFQARTTMPLVAPFTDPGTNDTHTCTVNWDDGAGPQTYPASGSTCNQTHVFANAGMYTISLTVADDDGGTDAASVMVVVYDPDAGWTNMDGSVPTPSGALVGFPAATEWTWAHLAAHYYTQQGPPVGAARTWVPGTAFRMDWTELHWLVLTPDGKIAVKGTGRSPNGTQLGFVFYGYNGCPTTGPDCQAGPDRMRLVVWTLSSGPNPGSGTVYDNRASAGYDIDVVEPQVMNSGAVQIHH